MARAEDEWARREKGSFLQVGVKVVLNPVFPLCPTGLLPIPRWWWCSLSSYSYMLASVRVISAGHDYYCKEHKYYDDVGYNGDNFYEIA